MISRRAGTGQPVKTAKSELFVVKSHAVAQIEVAPASGDIDKIEMGDRASINVNAVPGRSFDGKATKIRKAQNMVVLSAPDAEGVLEPGMTATARIVIDERIDVLRAPNEALRYSRNRNATQIGGDKSDVISIWVLRKGKPMPVPVRLGLNDGRHTEVVEGGFQLGDELIIGERD